MMEVFLREFPDSQYARLARVELAGTVNESHAPPEPHVPAPAAGKLERAGKLLHSRQFDEARKLYNELAIEYPKDPEAHLRISESYREEHEYQKARAAFERARTLDHESLAVRFEEVNLLAAEGKTDDAVEKLKTMLDATAKPSYSQTEKSTRVSLLERLIVLYDIGRRFAEMAEALDSAEKFCDTPQQKTNVYFMRGVMYERMMKSDAAQTEFRKLLAVEPDHAGALNYLGYMFADSGMNLDEAAKMVSRALELDPQNGAYMDSLGWIRFRQNRLDDAEKLFIQALARVGKDPTIHDHLGELYIRQGKTRDAIIQWQASMKEYETGVSPDTDAAEVARINRKLESAKVRLAKEGKR